MLDPIVKRLHRSLVQALRARGADSLDRPVTVAEIYQDLVPYRSVRETLDVEMNADYEHALLRLLAGEGGLARLEPESARDELRKELDSPNPYVGAYRNFAACDVFITAPAADDEIGAGIHVGVQRAPSPAIPTSPAAGVSKAVDVSPSVGASPSAGTSPASMSPAGAPPVSAASPVSSARADAAPPPDTVSRPATASRAATPPAPSPAPSGGSATPSTGGPSGPAARSPAGPSVRIPSGPAARSAGGQATRAPSRAPAGSPGAAARKPERGGACAFCAGELPSSRAALFCPHCGADQRQRPCPECSEPLDRGWQYCIRCGTAVSRRTGAPAGGG